MGRIAVAGASGLVGVRLCTALASEGHAVLRLVRRDPLGPGEVQWDPDRGRLDAAALDGIDGFVHLSGESIASGRWSPARKRRIVESRTVTTRLVSAALARLGSKPVLVAASAIGYYGDRGGEWVD
ncbi:MAG: NAD-dependent epimerase/dehydratase family protein, partial [Solirubrobacteraceae bacterium]